MDLAQRVARRQGRRQDLGAVIGLILFILVLFGAAALPGFLVQSASTVRVPAQQEAHR